MMPDNEKAATFIGWKPGQRCENREGYETFSGFVFSTIRPQHNARCLTCGFKSVAYEDEVVLAPHDTPAPDMSDPRNYMKALEAVAARDLFVEMSMYSAGGAPHYTRFDVRRSARTDEDMDANLLARGQSAEPGTAATEALAALYDAEHPEGKP